MPIMNKVIAFARSRKGRELTQKATRYAQSPEGKRKLAETRERLASRRRVSR